MGLSDMQPKPKVEPIQPTDIPQVSGAPQYKFNHFTSDSAFQNPYDIEENIIGIDQFLQQYASCKPGSKFNDNEFPSNMKSLCESSTSNGNTIWRKYVWQRPESYLNNEYEIFCKKIQNVINMQIGAGRYIDPRDIQ